VILFEDGDDGLVLGVGGGGHGGWAGVVRCRRS